MNCRVLVFPTQGRAVNTTTVNEHADRAVQATAWFSVLMSSSVRGEFQEAARAQQALERLGVQVRFRRPRREAANAQ